jgi:general secretion pathway protein F
VLERLSDYLETRHNIQQKISVALVYPIFLTITSISIVIALVAFVVPKVVKVFEDTGQDLPMLTSVLIKLSSILQQHGLTILLLLVILSLFAKFLFSQEKPRYWLHSVFLNTVGTKRLVRNINTARMARTLAIMVGSGVPLLTSMKSSLGVLSNVVLQGDLRQATNEVAEGVSVSRALSRQGHFPPLLIQMVASGENNGQLSKMLEKAATATENELQSRITIITSLFEPIMILVMGLVVLVIVLAILMPIFDLNQIIS